MFKDIKVEEILVYLMLIIVGYYIAKMFSRSCNGFSVGGQQLSCSKVYNILNVVDDGCQNNKVYNSAKDSTMIKPGEFNDICCQ